MRRLIFIVTIAVCAQAAPKTYSSLADPLEAMTKDCKNLESSTKIPPQLVDQCNTLSRQTQQAFSMGESQDKLKHKDPEQMAAYLSELRKADKTRSEIRKTIYFEKEKAMKGDDLDYYKFLVANHAELNQRDLTFMDKHAAIFKKNPQYLALEEKTKEEKRYEQSTTDSGSSSSSNSSFESSCVDLIEFGRMQSHGTGAYSPSLLPKGVNPKQFETEWCQCLEPAYTKLSPQAKAKVDRWFSTHSKTLDASKSDELKDFGFQMLGCATKMRK